MFPIRFIVCLLFGVFFCLRGSLSQTTDYDQEAQKFLDEASEISFKLYASLANESFNSDEWNEEDKASAKLNRIRKISMALVKLSNQSREFDTSKITSEDIKKGLMETRISPDLTILGDEYYENIWPAATSLMYMPSEPVFESYMNDSKAYKKSDELLRYDPDILEVIQSSNDPKEILYYWEIWREKNSGAIGIHFNKIFEALKKTAQVLDIPILDFWYRYYNTQDFIQDMEKVMQQLKPTYQQLHAYIRGELLKKYGSEQVDANGPLPDHLVEQVTAQAWHPNSVLESDFPFSELPSYNKFVEQKYTNAREMLDEANRFYTSLGFESFDEEFMKTHTKQIPPEEGDAECIAEIIDETSEVYISYCSKIDYRKFMQMHAHMTRAYYSKQDIKLPFHFIYTYSLEYPLGEAVILSASTPKHLKTIGMAKDFEFSDKVTNNRLIRLAVHTYLNIARHFVINKVLEDLLTGSIEMKELNKRYWKLMNDYAGIEPPVNRNKNFFDFPYKSYADIEYNHQTTKFVAEIMGYQFYEALCKKSGQDKELQNCDFYGNKEAGDAMKSMMVLGSNTSFGDVVGNILSDKHTLDAEALLEYYAPILKWIEAKNKESNNKIGWNESKKEIL